MNSFYRKLDILNRVYVLNYFDLNLLECSAMLRIPDVKHIESRVLQSKPYFNLADISLILAGFSQYRINKLFSWVLFFIVSLDKSLALDAKILTQLQESLDLNITKLVFSESTSLDHTFSVRKILHDYTIEEVTQHLKHIYFQPLANFLPQVYAKRFKLTSPQPTLINKLKSYNLDEIVIQQFQRHFATLSAVAKELAGN